LKQSKSDFSIDVVEFDDGHRPALAQSKENTKLALNRNKTSSKFVSVYDDLLPSPWPQRIYDYAMQRGKPWGVYVLTKDLLEFESNGGGVDADGLPRMFEFAELIWQTDPERAFATCATYALVMQRARGLIGPDVNLIHGTAVWCLCSGVTNSVEYHIDYAELYRYETNVIHPPLYAGTCHMTPAPVAGGAAMKGGDFCVNTGGIEHYRVFGYKAKFKGGVALEADIASSCDWQVVRYKSNRGILHDGDLPHLSTPIVSLPDPPGTLRVILGFNCFTSEVGECCIRAPEHSQAFNRTVKLYQAIAAATGGAAAGPGKYDGAATAIESRPAVGLEEGDTAARAPKSRISAQEVLKNPALARLIVQAARKVREQKEGIKEGI